ncbi:hypothetical protein OC835_004205, partial [Tilletia horrida]
MVTRNKRPAPQTQADDYASMLGNGPAANDKRPRTTGPGEYGAADDAIMTDADIDAVDDVNIKAFLRIKPLTSANGQLLNRMMDSFKQFALNDQLDMIDDTDEDGVPVSTTSHAPFHVVAAAGLQIYGAQLHEQGVITTSAVTKKLASVHKQVKELLEHWQSMLTEENKDNIRHVTTTFWFSPATRGYSVGSLNEPGASSILEAAIMILGPNGAQLMHKSNAFGDGLVRPVVKAKLDSLRNNTKDKLHKSLGLEKSEEMTVVNPEPLPTLAFKLLDKTGVERTPLVLRRICFLRKQAQIKNAFFLEEVTDKNGEPAL